MWRPLPEWAARGVCSGRATRDSDPWHGDDRHETDEQRQAREATARAICAECPVLDECLSWHLGQLAEVDVLGVVAGLTPGELRAEARRRGFRAAAPARHGTRSSYVGGCRCGKCRDAHRVYERERRAVRLASERELAPSARELLRRALQAAGGSLLKSELRLVDGVVPGQVLGAVRKLEEAGVVRQDRLRVHLLADDLPEAA